MTHLKLLLISSLLSGSWCADEDFPEGFMFGAATAAYQVEGAWNTSGKGENVWDRFTHEHPEVIADRTNGDIACDSYHQWKQDLDIVSDMKLHFYRFSISWSRLLPTGFPNHISEDGKKFYNNLIDGLLQKGIEPLVTIYHFDLPQILQDLGGWTNPLIVDWFAGYARVVFTLFAKRVKMWITINEPLILCELSYNSGMLAPGIIDPEIAPYLCNKYTLMAHAKAWRIYDKEFKPKYKGQVSISNQLLWFEPSSKEHQGLAELALQNCAGRYSHPIYSKEGGWPPAIEKLVAENSKRKGYPRTNLPPFTKEEIELVKGTYDYYAMNYYTSRLVRPAKDGEKLSTWPVGDIPDLNAKTEKHPDWPQAAASWYWIYPPGIRRQLAWLKKTYGDLKIFITENGLSTRSGLDDQDRVRYYKDHLKQVLLAIKRDGVNVVGYTAWTLIDNFEWMDGYTVKFGLYEVNFTSPLRTRTPRASARYYKSVIQSHSLRVHKVHTSEEL